MRPEYTDPVALMLPPDGTTVQVTIQMRVPERPALAPGALPVLEEQPAIVMNIDVDEGEEGESPPLTEKQSNAVLCLGMEQVAAVLRRELTGALREGRISIGEARSMMAAQGVHA